MIKFGEFKNDSWVFRFASYPRFGHWAYNIFQRKRLLSQANFYIKHNFGEHLPTVDELCEMLHSSSHTSLMRKIQYYAKKYLWNQFLLVSGKGTTQSNLEQIGTPTILWTLSCAEFHWPEFHTLFGDVNNDCNTYKKNVINNPHILDLFFTEGTESFVKHWLYNTLGVEWHWYRFEYAVVRAAIHCTGFAKLKDDPGLCDLTSKAVSAKQLLEKGKSSSQSNLSELD